MAVKKLYVKPETRHHAVYGESLMEQEIIPVVSDGETEVNRGYFDDGEGYDEDTLPKYPSVWD